MSGVGCAVPQLAGEGRLSRVVEPGTKRGYWLYLPKDCVGAEGEGSSSSAKVRPLVVTFHGMKPFDCAHAQAREWEAEADRYGLIAIAPELRAPDVLGQFPVRSVDRDLQSDEKATLAILEHVFATTPADRHNVLSTSWSSGGYMAHYMLNRHPDRFTCLAVRQSNFTAGILDSGRTLQSLGHPVLIVSTENDFAICKRESSQAVDWYKQHNYRALSWLRLKTLGHERTPEVAADFFAHLAGVTPNRPSEMLAHRQVLDGEIGGSHFSATRSRESGSARLRIRWHDPIGPRPPSWRAAMMRSIAQRAGPYLVAPTVLLAAVIPLRACSWIEAESVAGAMLLETVGSQSPAYDFSSAIAAEQYDPIELLRHARQRCAQEVRDYSCVFLRQERLAGELTAPQTVKVLYREDPRSVYMTWIRNTARVRRALYVEGRLVNEKGEAQALVEPAGAIARLFINELKVPIHGAEARKSGRFTIDQFGFHAVLDRILRDNQRFAALGSLEWTYEGEGSIDGRPTHVLVRHLPYAGPDGEFPDARLVVHLDQEWLWPVGIHSFADEQERRLLGTYVTTRVDLNPGLTDPDFEFVPGK